MARRYTGSARSGTSSHSGRHQTPGPGTGAFDSEVALEGRPAEFRRALRSEIDASRRNASSAAIGLLNGRRIGQIGLAHQYKFSVENALNLPGDSPADLIIRGEHPRRTEATVVSVEGLMITLSVSEDLGSFISSARLESNPTLLMRKLIERIEQLKGRGNAVGDRLIDRSGLTGAPVKSSVQGLDDGQRGAVERAVGTNLTFVWGPPGTGKTKTIGAIGFELFKRGRPLLAVSHTNTAVDGALLQIASRLDEKDLAEGRVIRVGDPKQQELAERPELLLSGQVARRSADLTHRRDTLLGELDAAVGQVTKIQRTLDILEWVEQAQGDLAHLRAELGSLRESESERDELNRRATDLAGKEEHLRRLTAEAAGAKDAESRIAALRARLAELDSSLVTIISGPADPQVLRAEATDPPVSSQLDRSTLNLIGGVLADERTRRELVTRQEELADLFARTSSVGALLRRWRKLPEPTAVRAQIEEVSTSTHEVSERIERGRTHLVRTRERTESDLASAELEVLSFFHAHGAAPGQALDSARALLTEMESCRQRHLEVWASTLATRARLSEEVRGRLVVLQDWELVTSIPDGLEDSIERLSQAWEAQRWVSPQPDGAALREERVRLNRTITELQGNIEQVNEALAHIEELVIRDASVVATTLTRAYLRDSIQSRRFDTVLLDEASMAPIPALWVAASLADENAVVVGDFYQLPPIVQSRDDIAVQWLGQDIFSAAGIRGQIERGETPADFVQLRWQYRMQPGISRIANDLFYGGALKDGIEARQSQRQWPTWAEQDAVCLVDTSAEHAWVTSVSRAGGSSRLNFLSAALCVRLAEQMLDAERPPYWPGDRARVLLICPYRPHARLMELMVREAEFEGEVVAGTVHNFQGSEAETVILDLVNDDPHWKVGMFMPTNDEANRQLLNVAITRAQERLIVVGDFDYIEKNGKRSFLGASLVPYLRSRYPTYAASDLVQTGLSAAAAQASIAVVGGERNPGTTGVVVTQDEFFPLLMNDMTRVTARAVIYSPFVTQNRLSQLEPHLRAMADRGVAVFIVTKARGDRTKRDLPAYVQLEDALESWGATVIHKRHMHEKLVFLDDDILWSGSLNPLSQSASQEVMERRVSRDIVSDYARTLRLEDLVGEYTEGDVRCPICGQEVLASEGKDEPFYWRCVEDDCYSRGVDAPRIKGGVITCANCGGDVEFGEWGDEAAWRCCDNRRHRQRIARTHLRLPTMRQRIPKPALRVLDKRFGIKDVRP